MKENIFLGRLDTDDHRWNEKSRNACFIAGGKDKTIVEKAFKERNISVFVLFDVDKSLNYVFISVKHDSWSLKGDLIKFQARNIMRENFNFSHETREEDVPVRGLCSSCLALERISRTSFQRLPDHPRFFSRFLDVKFKRSIAVPSSRSLRF